MGEENEPGGHGIEVSEGVLFRLTSPRAQDAAGQMGRSEPRLAGDGGNWVLVCRTSDVGFSRSAPQTFSPLIIDKTATQPEPVREGLK